jgi:hypothetical protein
LLSICNTYFSNITFFVSIKKSFQKETKCTFEIFRGEPGCMWPGYLASPLTAVVVSSILKTWVICELSLLATSSLVIN